MLSIALLALALAPDTGTLAVDVILNGSFEAVADSTTKPPKYGAYWKNAFVPKEGVADCSVVALADGNRVLKLAAGQEPVGQVLTLYGPHADRFELEARVQLDSEDARLEIVFETEGARRVTYSLPAAEGALAIAPGARDAEGFAHVRLHVGADMARELGLPPQAWTRVDFRAAAGTVLVDDVVGAHRLPRVAGSELARMLRDDVRDQLAVYLEEKDGPSGKGRALVDAETGYLTGTDIDVASGEVFARSPVVAIHGIHEVMLRYLRSADPVPAAEPLRALVADRLKKHAYSLLKNNVFAKTGLYCLWNLAERKQIATAELSPSHFIEHVLGVAALFPNDKVLDSYARFHCEAMADAMVKLRKEHDLPRGVPFGRGPGGNWFGRLPEKVSALGVLAPPKQSTYDQAWAISQDRSWYHDFDTCVGLMKVYAYAPKPEYRDAVLGVIRRFDRTFDGTRYDMENDTDDHYGVNVEACLQAYRVGGCAVPELLQWAQYATDLRLPRDRAWDDNFWVQGIRLGSFTTGDQPRAFRGPTGLHELTRAQNPVSSGFEGYEHAQREIAKADLRRRLLDDGYFTEASSWQWQMISACFLGDYIGPCTQPMKWEGDMGDRFEGPASNGFRSLVRTLEISRPGEAREFASWYAAVHQHTLELYRRPFGYRTGLPVETGRRYGIADKNLLVNDGGFTTRSPFGLATLILHSELLESGRLDRDRLGVAIESVARDAQGRLAVALRGPPGRPFVVRAGDRERRHPLGPTDWRLLATPEGSPEARGTLGADGTAKAMLEGVKDGGELGPGRAAVDAWIADAEGEPEGVDDLDGGVYDVAPAGPAAPGPGGG